MSTRLPSQCSQHVALGARAMAVWRCCMCACFFRCCTCSLLGIKACLTDDCNATQLLSHHQRTTAHASVGKIWQGVPYMVTHSAARQSLLVLETPSVRLSPDIWLRLQGLRHCAAACDLCIHLCMQGPAAHECAVMRFGTLPPARCCSSVMEVTGNKLWRYATASLQVTIRAAAASLELASMC